jgi:hypothetical protein
MRTSSVLRRCLLLGVFLAVAGASSAQECTCETAAPSGQSQVGYVIAASGQVLASAKAGLVQIGPGAELAAGSHLVVGPSSFADISVGTGCAISLGAGAEAVLVPEQEKICVRVNDPNKTAGNSVVHEDVNGFTGQQAQQTAAEGLKNVGAEGKSGFIPLLATPALAASVGIGAAAVGGALLLGGDTAPLGGGGTGASN